MERFTQRARRVLSLAQEEAERFQHNYIGTEHLLLGLIREEGGVAGRVLRELGLDQRRVEELVERMTRATARSAMTTPELSPGTKRVLELAVDEARRMGHHYIGTEHLLLGLVRLPEGVAIDILKRLGISPGKFAAKPGVSFRKTRCSRKTRHPKNERHAPRLARDANEIRTRPLWLTNWRPISPNWRWKANSIRWSGVRQKSSA
jgi:ATP-dependent Clp protease ATP-binding subunit ClpC